MKLLVISSGAVTHVCFRHLSCTVAMFVTVERGLVLIDHVR